MAEVLRITQIDLMDNVKYGLGKLIGLLDKRFLGFTLKNLED
tara:strand:+ start:97 stop:222 length:126 start_codon:yes stop_codon:yes gene_type:complete